MSDKEPTWERVSEDGGVSRFPVPGGWLYQHSWDNTANMVFVPDVVCCPHGSYGVCSYCIRDAIRDGLAR